MRSDSAAALDAMERTLDALVRGVEERGLGKVPAFWYNRAITGKGGRGMQTIPVIVVAAWSGTGKTTLLEQLIPVLKERGLRVCVMKHDTHEFEVDRAGKDSWRMTRAGADVTILTNGAHAAVLENRPVTAEVLLEQVHDVDLILTEGYKHGPWKKIALYRAAVGKPFPCALEECMAVVTDTLIADCPAPCLGFDEIEALADRIEEEIGR